MHLLDLACTVYRAGGHHQHALHARLRRQRIQIVEIRDPRQHRTGDMKPALPARGPQIQNGYAKDVVAHCARVGVELGADIVKVPYTGDVDSFSEVVAACCVPVVIAGGERMDSTRQILQMVQDSLDAGGAGISVGRNVFQHPNRVALVKALRAIVHENVSVDQAMEIVGE